MRTLGFYLHGPNGNRIAIKGCSSAGLHLLGKLYPQPTILIYIAICGYNFGGLQPFPCDAYLRCVLGRTRPRCLPLLVLASTRPIVRAVQASPMPGRLAPCVQRLTASPCPAVAMTSPIRRRS